MAVASAVEHDKVRPADAAGYVVATIGWLFASVGVAASMTSFLTTPGPVARTLVAGVAADSTVFTMVSGYGAT